MSGNVTSGRQGNYYADPFRLNGYSADEIVYRLARMSGGDSLLACGFTNRDTSGTCCKSGLFHMFRNNIVDVVDTI